MASFKLLSFTPYLLSPTNPPSDVQLVVRFNYLLDQKVGLYLGTQSNCHALWLINDNGGYSLAHFKTGNFQVQTALDMLLSEFLRHANLPEMLPATEFGLITQKKWIRIVEKANILRQFNTTSISSSKIDSSDELGLVKKLHSSIQHYSHLRSSFDPDFYTKEGRCNFVRHHGSNLHKLSKERVQVIDSYHDQVILNIFPGRQPEKDAFAIKTALKWLKCEPLKSSERRAFCQCATEKIIAKSTSPQKMQAVLMTLVFVDQFIHTHYKHLHERFEKEFPIPKLQAHSVGGMASPAWFIYERYGYEKNADFDLISKIFGTCMGHLKRWISENMNGSSLRFDSLLEDEVNKVFPTQFASFFFIIE